MSINAPLCAEMVVTLIAVMAVFRRRLAGRREDGRRGGGGEVDHRALGIYPRPSSTLRIRGPSPIKVYAPAAFAAAIALGGCNSQSQLDPSTQAGVTSTYNSVCVGSAGQPSVVSAIDAYVAAQATTMNAQQANIWNSI